MLYSEIDRRAAIRQNAEPIQSHMPTKLVVRSNLNTRIAAISWSTIEVLNIRKIILSQKPGCKSDADS